MRHEAELRSRGSNVWIVSAGVPQGPSLEEDELPDQKSHRLRSGTIP